MQPLPVPMSATRSGLTACRALDQHLRVGVGHQDCGRHLEVQGHELLVADEIGDRVAMRAPLDQAAVAGQFVVG